MERFHFPRNDALSRRAVNALPLLFLVPLLNRPPVVAQTGGSVGRTLHVWVPHVAAGDWKTSVSLFNSGARVAVVRLERFTAGGQSLGKAREFKVPAGSRLAVPAAVLDYDGSAHLTSGSPLAVKVDYSDKDSRSIHEFYPRDRLAMVWEIPLLGRGAVSSAGVALVNQTGKPVTVMLKALREGMEEASSTIRLGPRSKAVRFLEQIWGGVSLHGLDTVVVQSSVAIPAPVCLISSRPPDSSEVRVAREKKPALPEPVDVAERWRTEGPGSPRDKWQAITVLETESGVIGRYSPGGATPLFAGTAASDLSPMLRNLAVSPGWPSLLCGRIRFDGLTGTCFLGFRSRTSFAATDYFANPIVPDSATVLRSNYFIPSDESGHIGIGYREELGGWFDVEDLQLLQWDPSRIEGFDYVRHLVGSAVYRMEGVASVRGSGEISFPLPVVHQGQVPLALKIFTEPPDRIGALHFREKWDRDWVATARVAAPSTTFLRFEAVVLECELADTQLASDEALERRGTAAWLRPTATVPSDDPEVRAAASEAVGTATEVRDKVAGILRWLKDHMTGSAFPVDVDARSVLRARWGSCTGWANLAAALGRAAGIPTRIVAGYPAWASPLQTHYINEFYLDGIGWYRVEPQSMRMNLPDFHTAQSYMSIVSVVHPEQEGPAAIDPRKRVRSFIAKGVPYLTLFEPSGNLTLQYPPNYFASSPYSDHAAAGVMNIDLDELGRLPYLSEAARARWTRFLKDAAAGNARAWMTRKFDAMFAARNLDELEDALYVP
jgi:hypothetical protein